MSISRQINAPCGNPNLVFQCINGAGEKRAKGLSAPLQHELGWVELVRQRKNSQIHLGGDEQFQIEQTQPEWHETGDDVVFRTREIARWRETGEPAYERDFVLRLTLDDEKIVRVVVMPGGEPTA